MDASGDATVLSCTIQTLTGSCLSGLRPLLQPLVPQLQPPHSPSPRSSVWAVTSNHGVTFELVSPAPGYSHLGSSVLTRRLLVQLIAICIALLISQHCLCDISISFSLSGCVSLARAPPAFWGEELDSVWCVIKYSRLKRRLADLSRKRTWRRRANINIV